MRNHRKGGRGHHRGRGGSHRRVKGKVVIVEGRELSKGKGEKGLRREVGVTVIVDRRGSHR